MRPLGEKQLLRLISMGSPAIIQVSEDGISRSLVKRGFLREVTESGATTITPVGLCALAEEMVAGRVDRAIAKLKEQRRSGKKELLQ